MVKVLDMDLYTNHPRSADLGSKFKHIGEDNRIRQWTSISAGWHGFFWLLLFTLFLAALSRSGRSISKQAHLASGLSSGKETMAKGIIYLIFFSTLHSPASLSRTTGCGIVLPCSFSKGEPRRGNCRVAAPLSGGGRQLGAGHVLEGEAWVSIVVKS